MDKLDLMGWIIIVLLIGFGLYVIPKLVYEVYSEIHSYNIMQEECDANPELCFCDDGICSIKSSCSYMIVNNELIENQRCDYSKICEIVTESKWKKGIWEYDCIK